MEFLETSTNFKEEDKNDNVLISTIKTRLTTRIKRKNSYISADSFKYKSNNG
jgi:hypothetical protein